MPSEQWETFCQAEAAPLGVRPEIHPDDFIYRFIAGTPHFTSDERGGIRYYFTDGRQSARNLLSLLTGVCKYDGSRRIRLLEFASGYGCVTRHLGGVIPFLDVTACDIHPRAMDFIRGTLGIQTALSASRPEDLSLDGTFDVVFALSFFSHMPKRTFARWLDRLASCVKPGGFFIFTAHGVESKTRLPAGEYDPEGFFFIPDSEQKDLDTAEYGLTATLPQYVLRNLLGRADGRLKFFQEAFWWKHQDVYVVQRDVYPVDPEVFRSFSKAAQPAADAVPPDRIRELQVHEAELEEIKGSRAYGLFQGIRRMRSTLVPYGSRRDRAVSAAMNALPGLGRAPFSGPKPGPAARPARTDSPRSIRELAAGRTDDEYYSLLLDSIRSPVISGVKMPGFPPEEVQKAFVGCSNETALALGYDFYRIVIQYCASLGVPVARDTRILDFGCGWGRIARFFFKDVDCPNVFGVDVDPGMIAFCEAEMTCGRYRKIDPEPPMTCFENGSLDVVFAYSVFSHLAESVAREWIREFARVLAPGGILLATTQRRDFLDFCASLQAKTGAYDHVWHKGLARSFIPIEKAKTDYDSGEFLFSATGAGEFRDKSFYGEALIPRAYIEREYSRFLILRDFQEHLGTLPQALFVMQKGA
jgi:SAM-dependent methyltransferase